MKQLRYWIPVLGILSLFVLFFQMPEAPDLYGLLGCKDCSSSHPFLVFTGAAYFAVLIAVSLLFPNFPNRQMAYCGLIWSILLAAGLTYLHFPKWCTACLIGHSFNILIWTFWMVVPSSENESVSLFFKERIFFAFLTPLVVVVLFACLNVTFLIYQIQDEQDLSTATTFKSGDAVPPFILQTTKGTKINHENLIQHAGTVVNFVTANCPYCNQQLPILDAVAKKLGANHFQFINVSHALTDDLILKTPSTEWAEDKEGVLHSLFNVKAYPTTFIIGNDGKIREVILGVPEHLETHLLSQLTPGESISG